MRRSGGRRLGSVVVEDGLRTGAEDGPEGQDRKKKESTVNRDKI